MRQVVFGQVGRGVFVRCVRIHSVVSHTLETVECSNVRMQEERYGRVLLGERGTTF